MLVALILRGADWVMHERIGDSLPGYVTAGDCFTCFGVWLVMSEEESAPSEATPNLGTQR